MFLGPHVLNTQHPENMLLAGARLAAFAAAAALGRPRVEGVAAPRDLKDLVSASPDHWEITTAPKE